MPLDPDIRAWLDQLAKQPPPALWEVPIATLRANGILLREQVERVPVGQIEDLVVDGPGGHLPVRFYRPAGAKAGHPLIVFLHGGGFVLGSVASSDPLSRRLCAETGAMVAAVEYRLAPEHPYPAAVEDTLFAVRWCLQHAEELGVDASRVVVAGDSAGGNLAAVVTNELKGDGPHPLAGQALVYPVTDLRDGDYASRRRYASGYGLALADMDWFVKQYLPGGAGVDEGTASPMVVGDLTGVPPTLVMTAEYDPLASEGEAYARRLEEAGVAVTFARIAGANHGVLDNVEGFAAAETVRARLVAWLRQVLRT